MIKKFIKGISLIEIIVYAAVLAIIIGVVAGFCLWLTKSQIKSRAVQEVSDQANLLVGKVVRETRAAEKVYLSTSVFNSDAGQLSLLVKKYLPVGEESSYLDFFICQNALCLKKEGQDPMALSSASVDIKKFKIVMVKTGARDSLEITFEVSYDNPGNRGEKTASVTVVSTVSLRNYQQ